MCLVVIRQQHETSGWSETYFITPPFSKKYKAPCKRTQHGWMLHFASVCTPCCVLLDVVACCCGKFETGQTFQPTRLPTFLLFRDRRSVAQQCWIRLHSSSNIFGATTLINHGLRRLMGCTLPTMRCRSQTCWELLHPFAHHCQYARNNVGSCCARLHAA